MHYFVFFYHVESKKYINVCGVFFKKKTWVAYNNKSGYVAKFKKILMSKNKEPRGM